MKNFFFYMSKKKVLWVWFLLILISCEENRVDGLIQKADDEWIKGHNHTAIEILKSVLDKTRNSAAIEEALLRLGEIYYFSLGNTSKALLYFQELLRLNTKDHFGYKAHKYIAEIVEFSIKDYDQAIIEYQKLINNFDYSQENSNHQFRIASIYYKKQDYEQAIIELETLLNDYPNSAWVEESTYKITNILYTLKRCPESRQRYQAFVVKYPNSEFLGKMEFVMASCLEDEGNLHEALKKYKSIGVQYPYPGLLKMKIEGVTSRIQKKLNKKNRSKINVKSKKI